jgi:hypothetical protein
VDATRFDALTRWFDSTVQRRAASLFGASALGGVFAIGPLLDAEGKKKRKNKKKKCAPCRKKKKGKCKKHKPNGTTCGEGKICQSGSCIDIPCDPPCTEPATCVDGACIFPDCEPACEPPETCIEGACACAESQICGDICCATAVDCFEDPEICVCGNLLCSCPGDEPACQGGALGGCCLEEDTCDLEVGCVTGTCTAQNEFNTLAWASCNDNPNCWCFSRIENGISVCVDTGNTFAFCDSQTGCESDAACEGDDVCVDIAGCPLFPTTTGACVTPCAAP